MRKKNARRLLVTLICVALILLMTSSQAMADDHSRLRLVITAEPENDRFKFAEVCIDCGMEFVDYEEAWVEFGGLSYGPDGQAHALTVTPHLGEDVTMEMRFGLTPEDVTLTEPPAVEGEGEHTVYYEFIFTLWTVSFTKSGSVTMTGPEPSETEPTSPSEPERETEPTSPSEPERETEPTSPSEPERETEPTSPSDPERESEPTSPSEPERETEPTSPSDPERESEPTSPSEPERETEPTPPSEPERETEPTSPSEPERETEPTSPSEPERETEPTSPSEPERETEPTSPSEPERETEPTSPSEPARETGPTSPSEPERETEPTSPSEPEWEPAPVPVVHRAFIAGDGGRFRPDDPLARAELAVMAVRLAGGSPAGTAVFADVDPDSWYAPWVAAAGDMGLMYGRGGGIFDPEGHAALYELELVASRLASLSAGPVSADRSPVTRAQAVALLLERAGREGCDVPHPCPFTDVPPDHPLYSEIAEAAAEHTVYI